MVSSGLPEILLIAACFTLFGLMLVGAIGGPWLLFAKWGRWRLLLSTLAPLAAVLAVMTGVVTAAFSVLRHRRGGLPDEVEMQVVLAMVVVAGLLLACGVVILAALIDNRRWGVIATLIAAPVVLLVLMTGALFLSYRKASVPEATNAELGPTKQIAMPLPGEFAEAAHAAEVASPEDFTDETAGGEERPAWVDEGAVIPSSMVVCTAGPSVLLEDAQRNARRTLERWAWHKIASAYSAAQPEPHPNWLDDRIDLVRDRFHETRETSVGTVHFVHLLGDITPQDREYLERKLTSWYGARRTTQNFRGVMFGGVGVLALLGVTHLVLRRGASAETP